MGDDLRRCWLAEGVDPGLRALFDALLNDRGSFASVTKGDERAVTQYVYTIALLVGTSGQGSVYQVCHAVGADPAIDGLLDVFDQESEFGNRVFRTAMKAKADPAYEVNRCHSVARVIAFDTLSDMLAESADPIGRVAQLEQWSRQWVEATFDPRTVDAASRFRAGLSTVRPGL